MVIRACSSYRRRRKAPTNQKHETTQFSIMRQNLPNLTRREARSRKDASLAEQAYQLILDQILRGTLPLGSVVSRRGLAGQFGMSIVPVAEALQRLEMEGLVESRPRAGTRVRIPEVDEVRQRFEVREALECQSARLCAERITFQERLELKRAAGHVDALFARTASEEINRDFIFAVQKYHIDLHMKIAAYARSEALRMAIEKSHVLVFNWLYDTASGRRALPPGFHQELVESIIAGDPQNAEMSMRRHVQFGLEAVLQAVEPQQQQNWRLKQDGIQRGPSLEETKRRVPVAE
ncbi:MAG: GntR family transcriptional regulator [Terriglobia bacterium]